MENLFDISFLSDHFESIILFHVFWILGMMIYGLLLHATAVFAVLRQTSFNKYLFCLLLAGETALFVVTVYVFGMNMKSENKLNLAANLIDTTSWVKDDTTVYFIEDDTLAMIRPNGTGYRAAFESESLIREYHFSPDGRYILIVTDGALVQHDRKDFTNKLIASTNIKPEDRSELKGVISNVAWSPDSRRYCFRVARWSPYASQEQWYAYEIKTGEKTDLKTLGLKIPELFWDKAGESLYYSWFETLDTSVYASPYHVKLYRIFPKDGKAQFITQFPFNEPTLPLDNWALQGIALYQPDGELSFGRTHKTRYIWDSPKRGRLGINKKDEMYYVRNRWWRRYLYKIPRIPPKEETRDGRYRPGDFEVGAIRWLPSGRYVIMEHLRYGILVLDPSISWIGVLESKPAQAFGWYPH